MWKKYNFYTAELLQSADPGSPLYSIQALDVTSISSGRGKLVFGDSEGGVTLCDDEFSLRRFIAYEHNVNFVYQFKSTNMLLTIGNGIDYRDTETVSVSRNLASRFRSNLNANETYKWMLEDLHVPATMANSVISKDATLKLWLLDKIDENGQPLCLRSITLFDKIDEETITSLSVDETAQFIFFGCSSGHIYYLHGDLLRSKRVIPTLIPSQFTSAITSLFIPASQSNKVSIFVTTGTQVGCFEISLENKKNIQYTPLDNEKGCAFHCSCIDHANHLVIGRDEGLFIYTEKELVSSLTLGETKSFIGSYHDCILVGTVNAKQQSILSFYNITNTCEVFSMDVMRNGNSEEIRFVFTEWNFCFIMTEGHIVYILHEKPVEERLSILYERQDYSLALSLCDDWQLSEKEISSIHLAYANSLYEQKEYDKAIEEYCATIGNVDSAYVIRRFLDTSFIHQLIIYLESLHKHNVASSDHTLLLMNCYIKLHDNEKLQAFVYEKALGTHFNVSIAIEVLATSGYTKEGLYLAKENGLVEKYLEIQIEKEGSLNDALEYISSLPVKEAEKAMIRYGKVLVDKLGCGATDLLIMLSTNQAGETNPELFIQCFVDNLPELKRFLQAVTSIRSHCDAVIWNTLLELLLHEPADSEDYTKNVMNLLTNPNACYDVEDALILLQNSHCDDGLIYIYSHYHMNNILLKLYIDLKRYEEAIQLCKKEGKEDPLLWTSLLHYYSKTEPIDEEVTKEIVNAIELSGIVPLFEIIHILTENTSVSSQYIKELVKKQLAREKTIRDTDLLKQEKIQQQMNQVNESISHYQNHSFSFKQTRCIGCGLPLELPVVHFLCGHSYHKACVNMEVPHCPKCEITKKEKVKVDEKQILKELKESKDGFAYVTDCFNKDLFKETEEEVEEPEMNDMKEEVHADEINEDEIPIQVLDL